MSGVTRAQQLTLQKTALPDLDAQIQFCRDAEKAGIDSLLVDLNFGKPEPIALATALGVATKRINFMIAIRSGLLSPTLLVQQINTFSAVTNGRVSLNVVAGHSPAELRYYGDWLSHDERYARTEEFLAISHAFWDHRDDVNFVGKYFTIEKGRLNTVFISGERTLPELFIAGNSAAARDLAIKHGSCWIRLPDTPENLRSNITPVLEAGKEVGLRLSVVARPTRAEAMAAAYALLADIELQRESKKTEKGFVQHSDSVSIKATHALAETEWLTPYLWTGAVHAYGAPALALVGSPEDVASGIMEFKEAGVSQFIFSGWPKSDAMLCFGREVLPLVRQKEQEQKVTGTASVPHPGI